MSNTMYTITRKELKSIKYHLIEFYTLYVQCTSVDSFGDVFGDK